MDFLGKLLYSKDLLLEIWHCHISNKSVEYPNSFLITNFFSYFLVIFFPRLPAHFLANAKISFYNSITEYYSIV